MSTVTYTWPVAGTVPPTILQSMGANMVVASVAMADADTTAVITHNWQSPTADLSALFPTINMQPTFYGTAAGTVIYALTNSLIVTLTKGTAVGSATTLTVVLQRPHSIIR